MPARMMHVGLARRGAEDQAEAVGVAARAARLHQLDAAAGGGEQQVPLAVLAPEIDEVVKRPGGETTVGSALENRIHVASPYQLTRPSIVASADATGPLRETRLRRWGLPSRALVHRVCVRRQLVAERVREPSRVASPPYVGERQHHQAEVEEQRPERHPAAARRHGFLIGDDHRHGHRQLDVERDEDQGDDIEAIVEIEPGGAEGLLAALVGASFDALGNVRADKATHEQQQPQQACAHNRKAENHR